MTFHRPVTALVAGAMLLLPATAAADPKAVVELFTSQGCAACPPADRLLGELAGSDQDVIALTMPVSIWDYLGWSDTLALTSLTERQRAYSVARGDHGVYTPQAVINGHADVVGSDKDAIESRITADNAHGPALPVPVSLSRDGDVLDIEIGRDPAGRRTDAKVWLALIDDSVSVPIAGGENRGRKLVYRNVVRSLLPVGMWRGSPLTLEIPVDVAEARVGRGAVVLVQHYAKDGPGRIVGAALLPELAPARAVTVSGR